MEEKTLQQIFEETRAAALAGDAQAQYQLAYLYDRGEGTAVAPNKASVWYALAAEQGYPPARNEFAMLLLRKVQPSAKEEGVRLLRLSADAGDAQAMFRLGECFRKGWGTERDLSAGNHLAGIYGSVLQIPDIPVDTSKQGLYRIEVHMDNPA